MQAFFERCLTVYPLPSGDALADILVMFGLAHFELAPLLAAWVAANIPTSLTHFAHLLLDDVEDALAEVPKLWSPFSRPEVDQQLAAWLGDRQVRAALAAQLESASSQHWWPDAQLAARARQAHEALALTLL